jgi:hypothetical protein
LRTHHKSPPKKSIIQLAGAILQLAQQVQKYEKGENRIGAGRLQPLPVS